MGGGGAEGSEGPTGEGKYMKKRTCLNIRGHSRAEQRPGVCDIQVRFSPEV